MRFFDFHCDTLYRAVDENKSLNEPDFHLSFDRGKKFERWIQCMAVWIPDNISGKAAFELFLRASNKLTEGSERFGIEIFTERNSFEKNNHGQIFTLENARAINGDLENIAILKKHGIKIATLTWNAENEIGGGADAPKIGLKPFGKLAVAEFEKQGIICDVSHASDKMFWDVVSVAKRPVVATHSNSRKITSHKRNLTDEQFTAIAKSGGIVGLNFARCFLNNIPEKADTSDLLRHCEHFLSLGGEDVVCFGSDFDGTDMPMGINGIESMPYLYEAFLKHNYKEEIVSKIFFDNAKSFAHENIFLS